MLIISDSLNELTSFYYLIAFLMGCLEIKTHNFRDKSLGILTKSNRILDWLLPHNEAEHRLIELDEAKERWVAKYGQRQADWLYNWQSIVSVALFWFDRIVVKVLARK